MISWHRVGQKVTPIESHKGWRLFGGQHAGPGQGSICTIASVEFQRGWVFFALEEWSESFLFHSAEFRPVYPEIIEQLRTLPSLTPERVKEIEHV